MPLKTEIKTAVAQMDVIPGKPDQNTTKILDTIKKCREQNDDLIIFPEMAVPGYFLSDEWENTAFVKDALSYNRDIIKASEGITVIWGNVDIDEDLINEDGRLRKYNAAYIAQDGKLIGKTHKTLLPKYREFEDARHFYSLRKEAWNSGRKVEELLQPFTINVNNQRVKVGLILCEDMWSDDYEVNPVAILQQHGTDLLVNISCSPWTWRKNDKRNRVVKGQLEKYPVPFIYANNIGIQNNGKNIYLFDGNSTIYNPDGSLQKVANDYTEEIIRATITNKPEGDSPSLPPISRERDTEELYNGLIFGTRRIFDSIGASKVALGVSGGIDSALSAAILALSLGSENVYCINMPSRFNSETTKSAALRLCHNLKTHYTSVAIQKSFEYTVEQLNSAVFERLDDSESKTPVKLSSLNEENVQARDRGSRILAGVASALGAVFVNNGNKTEMAIGYATLYGDVNGAVSLLGDLYKTEVYELARYINKIHDRELIPQEILELPASAELSASQNVDEGKGDPVNYPYHDQLMKAFIEFRKDPEDILRMYLNGELTKTLKTEKIIFEDQFDSPKTFIEDLEHKWRLFKISYFKRIQSPPVLTVSKRAFGFDLREAQNGAHFTREYKRLKEKILSDWENSEG